MKNKGGRPPKFTEDVVKKLEEAFAIDSTITEACFYANITTQTYYNNVKEGDALFDRFEALRNRPVLKARRAVVEKLGESYQSAMDYLSRKRKSEFSQRAEVDQRVVLIGHVLKEIENKNVAQTTRQELPAPNVLLDKGQAGQKGSIPAEQSTGGVRAKKAQP